MAQRQLFQRGWSARALLRQPGRVLPSHVTSSHQLQTTACRLNHHIINVQDTEDYKKRVLDSKTPVIVDFHAAWCGPCKMLGPRLESLVSAHSGKVLLAKVDIDDNSELAMEHGVEAVPTVLALRAGKVVDKFIGMKDDDSLKTFIDGLVR